jgi:hypothetical protein
MDSLRGHLGAVDYDHRDYDSGDDDTAREPPPSPIGQDERRMQVRAYNHWASLLADRNFPSVEDLDPTALPDFGPYSVLLDFTAGIEDPIVQYLGAQLGEECGAHGHIDKLSDVPSRSLLSRITDHYMQILANQAPIGFEAEFVNQRGATILYRGILLPFSSDDDTIDFIYGVINWKEMADQLTSDELLLEIDQALDAGGDQPRTPDPVTDWADGPGGDSTAVVAQVSPLSPAADDPFPLPAFGNEAEDDDDVYDLGDFSVEPEEEEGDEEEAPANENRFGSLLSLGGAMRDEDDDDADDWDDAPAIPARKAPVPLAYEPEPEPAPLPQPAFAEEAFAAEDFAEPSLSAADDEGEEQGLYDCLAAARELALAARSCEDRSRAALYAAVGRAYDFSLAAQAAPREFDELVAESGLTTQDRAPMTPVVKLVFGADYDKTRLTEYAAVLSHAHRLGIERGRLAHYLSDAEGGLKGVVNAERQFRREESGRAEGEVETPRQALERKLRAIAPLGFEDIAREGPEFALMMIRRTEGGEVVVLGEIDHDDALVERAARRLVA